MNGPSAKQTGFKKLGLIGRKALNLSSAGLVKTGLLSAETSLPLIIQPAVEGVDLASWASGNREFIEAQLSKPGALLFRNFSMTVDKFRQFITNSSGSLIDYHERSSPRSHLSGHIYTSTDYPPHLSIFMHNENSYAMTWPLRIFFYCAEPAQQGGETPIADCRKIYQRLPQAIRERFAEKRVLYVRNFDEGLGLPWQTVFQTEERNVVEDYCRSAGYEVEWKAGGGLRTRRAGQAVARHPKSGEMVWFNHAAFFHVTTLDPVIRQPLLSELSEEELPNQTYYGDGTSIEPAALQAIRDAYRQEAVAFQWQQGDVLMLDNMLTAHGRASFAGSRKILVGMAEPFNSRDIEQR
jgi:alpha-ketoglutarate-dependent taurine dioxygenase